MSPTFILLRSIILNPHNKGRMPGYPYTPCFFCVWWLSSKLELRPWKGNTSLRRRIEVNRVFGEAPSNQSNSYASAERSIGLLRTNMFLLSWSLPATVPMISDLTTATSGVVGLNLYNRLPLVELRVGWRYKFAKPSH